MTPSPEPEVMALDPAQGAGSMPISAKTANFVHIWCQGVGVLNNHYGEAFAFLHVGFQPLLPPFHPGFIRGNFLGLKVLAFAQSCRIPAATT